MGLRIPPLLLLISTLLLLLLRWTQTDAAITAATISLASSAAGETSAATVAFTTGVTVPIGGSVRISFPTAFLVSPTALSATTGVSSSSTLSTSGSDVTVTIAGTAISPGAVQFDLDGITNPGAGTTSLFAIVTATSAGMVLESTTVAGISIVAGSISDGAVIGGSTNAGATTTYAFSFTTTIDLRVGSLLELEFPVLPASNFVISSASLASTSGVDAASTTVQVLGQFVRLVVAGSTIVAGTTISVTYGTIINPAAQNAGTFVVRSRQPAGKIYQASPAITGPTITSLTLSASAVGVAPLSYFAGVSTSYVVTFDNDDIYIPSASKLSIIFPSSARFGISGAALVGLSKIGTTNTAFSLNAGAFTATVIVGSVPIASGTDRSFTMSGIVNPGSSCNEFIVEYCTATWEDYTFRISDSAGNQFAVSTTVPGTLIVKKPLSFGRVRPLLKDPNTLTSATVTLDTGVAIPAGGSIEVVFPAGYSVDASATVSAASLVGIPSSSFGAVSVTGLKVSITLTAAISATSGLGFTSSGITTPSLMTIGSYIVRTRDAFQSILEESIAILGEGCTYLNDCNGHGQCTLLSKRCICDLGWGSPDDIAAYRSPDCTTRVCPAGASWNSVPTATDTAHNVLEECSGMGICDRESGRCSCFDGFTGAACERMACPNSCSGKGRCTTMRDMATMSNALPLAPTTTYSGNLDTTTWDQDRIVGCVCDSGWAVGVGSGEVQVTEYFGADCSLRHCPTGDDPDTDNDETDCEGVAAPGGHMTGVAGNKCLVECSNHGVCNYRYGLCKCFLGYTGFACQSRDVLSVG